MNYAVIKGHDYYSSHREYCSLLYRCIMSSMKDTSLLQSDQISLVMSLMAIVRQCLPLWIPFWLFYLILFTKIKITVLVQVTVTWAAYIKLINSRCKSQCGVTRHTQSESSGSLCVCVCVCLFLKGMGLVDGKLLYFLFALLLLWCCCILSKKLWRLGQLWSNHTHTHTHTHTHNGSSLFLTDCNGLTHTPSRRQTEWLSVLLV